MENTRAKPSLYLFLDMTAAAFIIPWISAASSALEVTLSWVDEAAKI